MSEEPREDDGQAPPRPQELVELADRCTAANIRVQWIDKVEDDGVWWYLHLYLPNGRDTRRVLVTQGGRRIKLLRSFDFSKYTFVGDYEAIASYSDRCIEAGVVSNAGLRRQLLALPNVKKLPSRQKQESAEGSAAEAEVSDSYTVDDSDPDAEDQAEVQLSVEARDTSWRLELSPASDEFMALRHLLISATPRALTLKLINVDISTHDAALQLLEDVLVLQP